MRGCCGPCTDLAERYHHGVCGGDTCDAPATCSCPTCGSWYCDTHALADARAHLACVEAEREQMLRYVAELSGLIDANREGR